jgi:hypothetical protein
MNKDLLEIFKNVNDWLKFAETKNATLIAFNSGVIFGIYRIKSHDSVEANETLLAFLTLCTVVFIVSIIYSLFSFVPRVKMTKAGLFSSSKDKSVIHFECLKRMSVNSILIEILGDREFTSLEKDLALQIKINSMIASRKYAHFTISIWLSVISATAMCSGLLYSHILT